MRILIVEDEMIHAMYLRHRLSAAGHYVVGIGRNGQHAIDLAQRLNPELILMDINLGNGMNGIDAAHMIKDQISTSFIFISGNTDLLNFETVEALQPVAILSKPILGTELFEAIEENFYSPINSCKGYAQAAVAC